MGRSPRGPRAALATWTFALALSGMLYSAYLTYLELLVIDAICASCVASAALLTAFFLLCLPDARRAPARFEGAGRSREPDV